MKIIEVIDGAEFTDEVILEHLSRLVPDDSVELVRTTAVPQLLARLLRDAPLRYDFSPLQNGPDEWRVLVCVRERPEPRSVTAYLGWDHDRLDAMLVRALDLAKRERWDHARALIADFRTGLFRHIEVEESILFPAFDDATGMAGGGPTEAMKHEHVAIREFVEGLVIAAVERSHEELDQHHAGLLGVLVEHNMKEETLLYPTTDRVLDHEERHQLVERMMLR
ncbi:MAG: hemerythrin domain-containing protein [Planctomycetes bacterium]|nr:hemerythrin domain-containing protein [Planctomycetota bacterium]